MGDDESAALQKVMEEMKTAGDAFNGSGFFRDSYEHGRIAGRNDVAESETLIAPQVNPFDSFLISVEQSDHRP